MKLRDWATALPEWTVGSAEAAEWTGAKVDFVTTKIGIEERRFLRDDETVTDLAGAACRRLFDGGGLKAEDVELLILVTQNPDHRLPHTSALLQDTLGLPRTCACFDIGLGCSGWVYGLSAARGFMAAEGLTNAVLVTCDPYSKVMHRSDKNTATIFGDAATASWLSAEAGAAIGRGDFGTDGSGGGALTVRAGGSARPAGGLHHPDPRSFEIEDASLYMDGRAIFNFMMRRVPGTVDACLEKNGLTRDEVDLFIFHQASRFMVETLRDFMRLPADKAPVVISRVGNTVSSTIPIVLEDLKAGGGLAGKKVLVCGFGVGLSWATNVLYF